MKTQHSIVCLTSFEPQRHQDMLEILYLTCQRAPSELQHQSMLTSSKVVM